VLNIGWAVAYCKAFPVNVTRFYVIQAILYDVLINFQRTV